MSQVPLSVEENVHRSPGSKIRIQDLIAMDINTIELGQSLSVDNTYVPYNVDGLGDPEDFNVNKDEFDIYLRTAQQSEGNALKHNGVVASDYDDIFTVFEHIPRDHPKPSIPLNYVPLSQSAIPQIEQKLDTTPAIQLIYELEEEYKPRYKTDNLSQGKVVRSPRYVSDRNDNHCVTLKIKPGLKGFIRIDWITAQDRQNIHYSMPYKMQPDSKRPELDDKNPIYQEITVDNYGLMRLYIILIKSKQDELKKAQPLQPFPPIQSSSDKQFAGNMSQLSPKKLIESYQLDKSHLAFTYCILSPDGHSYIHDWRTTVISTMMTEKVNDSSTKRKVQCPNCSCSFDVTVDEGDDIRPAKTMKRR